MCCSRTLACLSHHLTLPLRGLRYLRASQLCKRYYDEGADEVVFLNITSFRQGVVEDLPMLRVRVGALVAQSGAADHEAAVC